LPQSRLRLRVGNLVSQSRPCKLGCFGPPEHDTQSVLRN
jgi:hypothetical protein